MDIIILTSSFVLICLGIIGSFLPILPGPLTSWGGLFLIHNHSQVPENSSFVWITMGVALVLFFMDYFIPAIGTKKFGGTKYGAYGASIGLIIGLLFLGPFGILIGPFSGAYFGELLKNKNQKKALKSALGSLLGFLSGVFIKLTVTLGYLYFFCAIIWKNLI
tara:strand:+ start:523 stop:1011 length:489 start_codon:yes stop_codon:yes gene_type:complete